jgi:hypothetical protein
LGKRSSFFFTEALSNLPLVDANEQILDAFRRKGKPRPSSTVMGVFKINDEKCENLE